VSSAVAGEMLQDLKAGHILGGTPNKMQIGDLFGIAVSSLALFFPLMYLHRAYTFGTPQLPAPQAGLMASLAQGIVGGNMAWPLVVVGILMGFGLILIEVRSPMLFSVGMYLPLETTFAIFVGGVFRWITDRIRAKRDFNDAQKARVENAGILTAAGLIAGEALCGLVVAGFRAAEKAKAEALHVREYKILPDWTWPGTEWLAIAVLIGLALLMIQLPLKSAGRPDEPAPPTAIM
jgi:putative OPT family oligopeptide transporter